MDILQIALFVLMIIGIVLVIFSLISIKNSPRNNAMNYLEVDNTIKAIDTSIQEADKVIDELEKMSKNVFDELDGKYQEILFLYNLIDEKRKEIAQIYNSGKVISSTDINVADEVVIEPPNPRLTKINELMKRGLTVPEIAKELNIGQGEIKLILGIGKAR